MPCSVFLPILYESKMPLLNISLTSWISLYPPLMLHLCLPNIYSVLHPLLNIHSCGFKMPNLRPRCGFPSCCVSGSGSVGFSLPVYTLRSLSCCNLFHHVQTVVRPRQKETDFRARPGRRRECCRSEAKLQQTSPLYPGQGQKCGNQKGLLLCSRQHGAGPLGRQVDQNPAALL